MTYVDLRHEERAAVLAYQEAFDARKMHHLRTSPAGFIIDEPEEAERLKRELAQAARRWAHTLDALGCPPPPGIED
jgi:hypothetical protein